MKVQYRKYLQYNKLPRFVNYISDYAQGNTICGIIHLVKLYKSNPNIQIVSNTTLKILPYEKFNLNNIFKYKNKVIFLDNFDLMINNRYVDSRIYIEFIKYLDKYNNKLIISGHNVKYLSNYIIRYLKITFRSRINLSKHKAKYLILWKFSKKDCIQYKPINIRKYFKYYDTLELPNLSEILKDGSKKCQT